MKFKKVISCILALMMLISCVASAYQVEMPTAPPPQQSRYVYGQAERNLLLDEYANLLGAQPLGGQEPQMVEIPMPLVLDKSYIGFVAAGDKVQVTATLEAVELLNLEEELLTEEKAGELLQWSPEDAGKLRIQVIGTKVLPATEEKAIQIQSTAEIEWLEGTGETAYTVMLQKNPDVTVMGGAVFFEPDDEQEAQNQELEDLLNSGEANGAKKPIDSPEIEEFLRQMIAEGLTQDQCDYDLSGLLSENGEEGEETEDDLLKLFEEQSRAGLESGELRKAESPEMEELLRQMIAGGMTQEECGFDLTGLLPEDEEQEDLLKLFEEQNKAGLESGELRKAETPEMEELLRQKVAEGLTQEECGFDLTELLAERVALLQLYEEQSQAGLESG